MIVTRRLPAAVENRMIELFDAELNKDDIPMSRGEIAAAMMKADVLVPTISDIIDQKLLARAGDNLRLIASYGAGFDLIFHVCHIGGGFSCLTVLSASALARDTMHLDRESRDLMAHFGMAANGRLYQSEYKNELIDGCL